MIDLIFSETINDRHNTLKILLIRINCVPYFAVPFTYSNYLVSVVALLRMNTIVMFVLYILRVIIEMAFKFTSSYPRTLCYI